MMGQQQRTDSLFYYFRLEDQIPEDHLLRLIDRHVDLSFVRERLKGLYSSTGQLSAVVEGWVPKTLETVEKLFLTRDLPRRVLVSC